MAAATPLPVIIYDIPVRTGRKVAIDTMLQLVHDCPNIVGVKDASGDPGGAAKLVAGAPRASSATAATTRSPCRCCGGAVGVVSVASHWVGKELGEMIRLYLEGDVEGARELNAALIDAVSFQSSDEAPNPLPTKAVMRVQGLPAGECRLPMGPAPDWLEPKARAMLANLDLWRSSRPARAGVPSPNG